MDIHPWSPPVQFETDIGTFRILVSAEEACHSLLNNWPIEAGPKLVEARKACLDVMAGKAQSDDDCVAFIEACDEADMHVIQ
ncbi:DUF982 domain-containing protein [Labrys neptuniae]